MNKDSHLIFESYKKVVEQTATISTQPGIQYNTSNPAQATKFQKDFKTALGSGKPVSAASSIPPTGPGANKLAGLAVSNNTNPQNDKALFQKYATVISGPELSNPSLPGNDFNLPHIKTMLDTFKYAASKNITPEQLTQFMSPRIQQELKTVNITSPEQTVANLDVTNQAVKRAFDKGLAEIKSYNKEY